MKALIKKCLGYLGYEVRKVRRAGAAFSGPALSAIEHNSQAMRDSFYSDPVQIDGYLTEARRQFYCDVMDLLVRHVPGLTESELAIADYGCGPGLLLKQLGSISPLSKCHGYDFSPSGIKLARSNFPAAEFEARDLYQAYPDHYDVILCTEVLEHLEHPRRALDNLIRQLAPGGRLLLTVPDGRVDQYAGHVHFWSPESWKLFVEEATAQMAVLTGRIATRGPVPFLFAVIVRQDGTGAAHAAISHAPKIANHA